MVFALKIGRDNALKQLKVLCVVSGILLALLGIVAVAFWLAEHSMPWLFALILLALASLLPFTLSGLDRMEESIVQERKRAQQSREALITYVRVLSHEVRNPIGGILTSLEHLRELLSTPEQLRELSRIQQSAQVASDVLQNIVTMNKGGAPVEAETRNTNLRENVEACFRIVRFSNSRDLELSYDIDDSVPEQVICDPLRVSQILLNLLGNAIKYTEHGSVKLHVRSFQDNDVSTTQFTVTDEGPGIAPDALDALFEPYQQGPSEAAPGFSSSGLGLSLVKQLVLEMNGEITVESKPNIGSSFIVRLPLDVATTHSKKSLFRNEPTERRLQQARVLVAEDNEINQLVARRMLSKLGCSVTVAENGSDAFELHRKHTFDLILMDLQMPVLDGIGATQLILNDEKQAPHIVAMTANVLDEERRRCLEAGMSDFLAKPVKLDNLRSCLRKHGLLIEY